MATDLVRLEAAARVFIALDDGAVAAHGCMDAKSWDALEELYNVLEIPFPWVKDRIK